MIRELIHIPLCDLKVSKLNVRRHGPKEIDSLAASIAALGLIHPLLVRANGTGEGYEIVAGHRRYLAMKKLHAEDAPESGIAPCVVMQASDDAAAIEASLAENIARLPMDEIDKYEAFAALNKRGLDEAEIAAHFAISQQIVKRRLAIAHLHPDIRRLYRAGDIDAKILHLLTLATRERQAAWLALVRDPNQDAPPPWQLKAWLLGGAEIACDAALFDEADYQGAIAADLFGDTRYFTDSEAFWHLQNQAIAAERDRLLEAGWADVHVVPPDQRFQHWDYDKTSKSKGGAVYIDVEPDGRVTIYKGLVPRTELRRSTHSAIRDDGQPCSTRGERPELSAPLANYVDLVRHSAVRLALTGAPGIALRLMLAHAIGGGRWWQVNAEPQRPATTAIAEAVDALPSQAAFLERHKEVMALLDLDPDDTALVSHDGSGDRTANVFARLLGMPDVSVMQVLAVVMAETLAAGTGLIDTLGEQLTVEIAQDWQTNDAFFDLVRDRETVSAMLADVIGETAATSYLTETGPKKKTIIKNALAGISRDKVDGWTPRYLRFPQAAYTMRPMTAHDRASA